MLPTILTNIPGLRSKQLAKRLSQVESPGITYLAEDFPVFWDKALNANIWDIDGNCYLDFNSAFGVAGIGHSNPEVVEAINKQASQLIHGMGDVHPPHLKVEFLENLLSLLPESLNSAILSCNGSDACESALKTAQVYTQKAGIIAFSYGYHGLGYGALDLTHKPHFRKPFEERLTEFTFHAPYPNTYHQGEEAAQISLNEVNKLIQKHKNLIGSIIIEPIQGRGGVIVPPIGFLKALREICDQNNLLLILDEIYTGFGRTGSMFAFEYENIIPDLICLGKTIGGGLPLSICIGRSEIMQAWGLSNGESVHTSTFLGNPLACAAGIAVIENLKQNNWPQKNSQTGLYLLEKLKQLQSPFIGEIRGRGLMLGIELVQNIQTKIPFTNLANYVLTESLKKGLILLSSGTHGQVLSLSPPFVITESEIDFAVETLQMVLNSANSDTKLK